MGGFRAFRGWLVEHFLVHTVGARPILLLLDGHSSHYQPQLIEYAGVIIFCLLPHTTHESQPLDASMFKSLKMNWQEACHHFTQSNPSLAITKYRFSGLLNEAWGKTMNPAIICSGFRKCGVYPFNPNAMDVVLVLSTLRLAYNNRIPKYQVITTSISMKTLYQRSMTHPIYHQKNLRFTSEDLKKGTIYQMKSVKSKSSRITCGTIQ